MKLLIDSPLHDARLVSQARYQDRRRYYLLDRVLLVLRSNLELEDIRAQVVDAQVGWDVAQPGFCADEDVGRRRTKITIHRVLATQQADRRLSQVLRDAP